jgi:hypothetical protein
VDAEEICCQRPNRSDFNNNEKPLEIDDETRHLSIWIDESPEQTRRIIAASATMKPRPSEDELNIWRAAHGLMEQRAAVQIVLPEWFDHIHSNVYIGDLRVRRYFPTFVTICQTIALLRSFQPQREALLQTKGIIEVDFSDYAIAVRIFEPIFVHSIHHADDCAMQTRAIIKRISVRQGGTGVGVDDFAKEASISRDQAYARLATAAEAGAICRANKPEKTNRKLYLPSSLPRFLPHPAKVFQEVRCIGDFKYVDPFRDEWVRDRR